MVAIKYAKVIAFLTTGFAPGLVAGAGPEEDCSGPGAPGARSFEPAVLLEDSAYTSGNISVGDVNGDGHLDVILVKGRHWPLQNLVRLGDGEGGFGPAEPVGPGPDRSYTGALVDLDNDGDLDLVVSNDSPDPKRILHNDGSGRFSEIQQFGTPQWNTRHVSVADMNGDGIADVVAANRGGAGGTESYLCMGGDNGTLQEPCAAPYFGSATTITLADMDGDGDRDLVVPHRDGGQSRVLFNDGAGAFPDEVEFGPASVGYRSAAVADFDRDGVMDIAIIAPGSRTGIETPGPDGGSGVIALPMRGVFFGEMAPPAAPSSRGGGLSALAMPSGSERSSAGLRFRELQPLNSSSDRPYAILAHDVDGDGRTDLIVGHVEALPVIWFNEGDRTFTPVPFGDAKGAAYGFAVADLNGDGLNDIFMARSGAESAVYFGATVGCYRQMP